jgi:hypothetical protein
MTDAVAPAPKPKKHGRKMSKRMRAHLSKMAKARYAAKRLQADLIKPSKGPSKEFNQGFVEGILFARSVQGA